MPSLPLTPDEEKKALSVIGVRSAEDLFATVPPQIREKAKFKLDLGPGYEGVERGLTEHELRAYFGKLAEKNAYFPKVTHFLGGGIYDNVIPAIVNQLVLRGEFLTCYTPYQPEISQGTLQAIFEFQTLISRIVGMPIANASMYDGATATAEAALMSQRLAPKTSQKILVARSLSPDYRSVLSTFLKGHSERAEEIGYRDDGTIDRDALISRLRTPDVACVIVGYPNYIGVIEPLDEIKKLLPPGCLLVASVADPSALGLFEAPGHLGADIVVGEAHQLGTPMLFGGPHVGFFAARKEHLRQMPGRLCGETKDAQGNRAYTLTLSTREQHIRREKATSNICTNQGLIALRTTIYLSFLGKRGFQELASTNYSLFQYLTTKLGEVGIKPRLKGALHYREGIFEVPGLKTRFQKCIDSGVVPGIRLQEKWGPDYSDSLLITVHPKHTQADIDKLAGSLK